MRFNAAKAVALYLHVGQQCACDEGCITCTGHARVHCCSAAVFQWC
jgi:hypothetical protein